MVPVSPSSPLLFFISFFFLLLFLKEEILLHLWRYPSLSIHGIEGAFHEPGIKTVIPAKVIGKFSIRQVPYMDLAAVKQQVRSQSQVLSTVWTEVPLSTSQLHNPSSKLSVSSIQLFVRAVSRRWKHLTGRCLPCRWRSTWRMCFPRGTVQTNSKCLCHWVRSPGLLTLMIHYIKQQEGQ